MLQLLINQNLVRTEAPTGTVLLDLLRHELGLKGSKEGCREGDCGACTVLVGERTSGNIRYMTAASCLLPVGDLHGKHVVTIEGLNGEELSPVQQAMVDEGATQCGFCTPGIVVALTGFLITSKTFSLKDAFASIEGNICRCTGYTSIRRASERLVSTLDIPYGKSVNRIQMLVKAKLLPEFFLDIKSRLNAIEPNVASGTFKETSLLVAGGTDLFVQQADRLRDSRLEFLSPNPDLRGIRSEKDHIAISAATTMEEMKNNPLLYESFPGWERALKLVSSTLIRNRATVAGNLINASPIGDITLMLLALDARLSIDTPRGTRCVSLDAFYKDYKIIDLREGERVTEIRFHVPQPGSRFNFEKVSRREHLDIASVNTAIFINESDGIITQARLAAGGVAPVPLFLSKSSAWLSGKPLSHVSLSKLIRLVDKEITPIDDVRGTAQYKRRLLRRLIIAHFITCFPDYNFEELKV